jgi:hypothetical protein
MKNTQIILKNASEILKNNCKKLLLIANHLVQQHNAARGLLVARPPVL